MIIDMPGIMRRHYICLYATILSCLKRSVMLNVRNNNYSHNLRNTRCVVLGRQEIQIRYRKEC